MLSTSLILSNIPFTISTQVIGNAFILLRISSTPSIISLILGICGIVSSFTILFGGVSEDVSEDVFVSIVSSSMILLPVVIGSGAGVVLNHHPLLVGQLCPKNET